MAGRRSRAFGGFPAAGAMTRSRANAAELASRAESAAFLLANGSPRTAAVSELAARFGVDRRTARRYVATGAEMLAAEIGRPDLGALLAESVERLKRLSHACEESGNLSAAVGAEKAAAGAVVALSRLESAAIGHTLALAESSVTPESDARSRRYRSSIRAPDPMAELPF